MVWRGSCNTKVSSFNELTYFHSRGQKVNFFFFISSEILKKATGGPRVSHTWYLLGSLSLVFMETLLQVWEVTEKASVFLDLPRVVSVLSGSTKCGRPCTGPWLCWRGQTGLHFTAGPLKPQPCMWVSSSWLACQLNRARVSHLEQYRSLRK